MRVECEICGAYCEVKNKKEADEIYEECNHICPNCLTMGSLYFNEKGERNEQIYRC